MYFLNVVAIFLCVTFNWDVTAHRMKRDIAGALEIVTNHAQPIHAEVKSDHPADVSEKKCILKPENLPSPIEPGVVFKVTAPKSSSDVIFSSYTLEKKDLSPKTRLVDTIRSISRVITLTSLVISLVLEFCPLFQYLYALMFYR